jgi:hypothetical protein
VHSLRDLGYDFPQAVADLVDNSITAGARVLAIDLRFEGADSWLRIADDGYGMTGDAITEALRYGSKQTYEEDDLGRFGLGLKTASLSQCRRLSVATRAAAGPARIEARMLDLDHVVRSDRWEIFDLAPRARSACLIEPLRETPGTVVLWQSLDRVLGYKIPSGAWASSAVRSLSERLSAHLGMVFHRFLSGEVEGREPIRILINGRRVRPWDPFARGEPATAALPGCEIDVRVPNGVGLVRFQPYVLPPRERFSSEESFQTLAGPRKWNAQQGLYIYRANRMIQSGGWCRLRTVDEHVKLARASIDFYPDLDPAFEINVPKVRVVVPTDLRERLREPIEMLVRAAQAAYRAHPALGNDPASRRSGSGLGDRVLSPTRAALERAAKRTGQLKPLRRILREIQECDPHIARRLGW